jgi:hypothetical protein
MPPRSAASASVPVAMTPNERMAAVKSFDFMAFFLCLKISVTKLVAAKSTVVADARFHGFGRPAALLSDPLIPTAGF